MTTTLKGLTNANGHQQQPSMKHGKQSLYLLCLIKLINAALRCELTDLFSVLCQL